MLRLITLGRVVIPVEAFVAAAILNWVGMPFIPAAGLVAVIVATDCAHVIGRAIENGRAINISYAQKEA